jgi:hypothetical protein
VRIHQKFPWVIFFAAMLLSLVGIFDISPLAGLDITARAAEPTPEEGPTAPPEAEDVPPPTRAVGVPQVFMDARAMSTTRDGKIQVFEGDVIAMSVGSILAADRIEVDQNRGVVIASGAIVLMTRSQVFTGDKVTYVMATGDFEMLNARMMVNDVRETDAVRARVLGITAEEVARQAAQAERLREIEGSKESVRRELRVLYSGRNGVVADPPSPILDRYTQLLDQEAAIRGQGNPALARLSVARRQAYERRRQYFDESIRQAAESGIKTGASGEPGYFRMEGAELTRTNGNDFRAYEGLWTPCRCGPGETPAWAFRSERMDAQIEGYADMRHAVLEVAGVPILYLPAMTVPLKDRRQSGILPPTSSYSPTSGSVMRLPVYFAWRDDQDATVNVDWFEKRGTRLGVEYRWQQRTWSGWEFRGETLRDRLWLTDRGKRSMIGAYYRYGLERARENYAVETASGTPGPEPTEPVGAGKEALRDRLAQSSFWTGNSELSACLTGATRAEREACEDRVNSSLETPANAWRGEYSWRGMTFLAPRLSLVSRGEIVSDHRYSDDLYLASSFAEAMAGNRYAPTYFPARARLHADLKDFYLGLGTTLGDNVLTTERFSGQQMPAIFSMQSRMFNLAPETLPFPVYGQASLEHRRIQSVGEEDPGTTPWAPENTLTDGSWTRTEMNLTTPIFSKRVVQISHFLDADSRFIEHPGFGDSGGSTIQSWRTGFTFQLPIDGKGLMPSSMQPDETEMPGARRYLHHVMNWSMTLFSRPPAVRTGSYGRDLHVGGQTISDQRGQPAPVFFSGDRKVFDPIDDATTREISLAEFRGATFSTTHAWHDLVEGWSMTSEARARREAERGGSETAQDRAKRELRESLERPSELEKTLVVGTRRISGDWEKVTISDGTPVTTTASISYNNLEERRRREVLDANAALEREAAQTEDPEERAAILARRVREANLPQPWSDGVITSGLSVMGVGVTNTVHYDLYLNTARKALVRVSLPSILSTSVSAGYSLERTPTYVGDALIFNRTRVWSSGISTTIIPHVTLQSDLAKKFLDAPAPTELYETIFGARYLAPSECWGLAFTRTKAYDKAESQAVYVLTLNVIFMGQSRPVGNNLAPVLRFAVPGVGVPQET